MGSYPTVIEQPSTGRKVLVVQTSGYGKYLGQLKVEFDSRGEMSGYDGNPVLLDSSKPKDQDLERLVQDYSERVKAKMDIIVGSSSVFIDGGRPKCRLEECSFGNLVTDAMASEMGAEVAVINSGAIKGSFDKGEPLSWQLDERSLFLL
jgi:2',3'-cyclic-nucleotide 2'-phosphodiesterase (5'-nucleotidase family)